MKTAFFLGGTSGLGEALAAIACSKEFHVVVAGRSANSCELVRQGQAKPLLVDLSADQLPRFEELPLFDLIVSTTGTVCKGSFTDLDAASIRQQTRVNFEGPLVILSQLLRRQIAAKKPCDLIIVSSTTSWRVKQDEALYGGMKAGISQVARNLGKELPIQLPGSNVLLAQPGGMKTPFWDSQTIDTRKFMTANAVAAVVWTHLEDLHNESASFLELQIVRGPDGDPQVSRGSKAPESVTEFPALDSSNTQRPICAACEKPIESQDGVEHRFIDAQRVHEDCYFKKLGELIEQYPIGRPIVR